MEILTAKPGRNDACPCGSGHKFKRCCGRAPPPVPNPLDIGTLVALMDAGRADEAERQARARLEGLPDAGILWKALGVAQRRQGKEALPALERTVQLLPRDAEAQANFTSALLDEAQSLRERGRASEAIPFYQRVLALDPLALVAENDLGNALSELGQYAAAADAYRRAVALAPRDARVRSNLARALRHLGLMSEAADVARQAMDLGGHLSDPHTTLGIALAAQGDLAGAVASYQRALTLNPRSVETLNHMGNALRDSGELEPAARCFRQAIALEPQTALTHDNLGNVELDGGLIEAAATSYSRAIALDRESAASHLHLSMALRRMGRATEAESSCRTALSKNPHFPEALSFLAELHADRGRFTDAEGLFRRAIALDPDFPNPWCGIALHRRMTREDTEWLQKASALAAKSLPLRHRIALRYALGKYFDDVHQYDQAFEHYREANELTKRFGSRFDREKLTQRVDAIIQGLDSPGLPMDDSGAHPSERPVLIVGMPRSGTTLCEQILASHPAVFGAGELNYWDAAAGAYRASRRDGGPDLSPALGRGYLERLLAQDPQAARVVDKMPANFMHLGLIHAALPGARIIHMRRHPIDTCLSIYFQHFANTHPYANDLEDLTHYHGEYARLMSHWRGVLPAARFLEVDYEGLVADQEGSSRRMVEFLGLPWDPRCLEFQQTERVVITTSKWQVRQKIHSASAGRWHNYRQFIGPLQRLSDGGTLTLTDLPD